MFTLSSTMVSTVNCIFSFLILIRLVSKVLHQRAKYTNPHRKQEYTTNSRNLGTFVLEFTSLMRIFVRVDYKSLIFGIHSPPQTLNYPFIPHDGFPYHCKRIIGQEPSHMVSSVSCIYAHFKHFCFEAR